MIKRRNDNAFNEMSFPCKIYAMLQDAEACGYEDVIAWQPGGKSFKVHKPEKFASSIMSLCFAHTKYKSFQRQLNIYGWKKIHHGENKGGYIHKYFIRGKPQLCSRIKRSKDSHNPNRKLALPSNVTIDTNPMVLDFATKCKEEPMDLNDSDVKTLCDLFYPDEHEFSDDTTCLSSCQGSATSEELNEFQISEEDFDGFLTLLTDDHAQPAAEPQPAAEDEINEDTDDELELDHSFPFKLHLMLETAAANNYSHVVSWIKDGTAFKVHDCKNFVEKVMPIYFDQSKYESFRRQLNLYGFTRVARGADRGVISHPCLIAGARSLCREIKRKQQTKHNNASTLCI